MCGLACTLVRRIRYYVYVCRRQGKARQGKLSQCRASADCAIVGAAVAGGEKCAASRVSLGGGALSASPQHRPYTCPYGAPLSL